MSDTPTSLLREIGEQIAAKYRGGSKAIAAAIDKAVAEAREEAASMVEHEQAIAVQAQQQLAAKEAEVAALRDALEAYQRYDAHSVTVTTPEQADHGKQLWQQFRRKFEAALASNAGEALLARLCVAEADTNRLDWLDSSEHGPNWEQGYKLFQNGMANTFRGAIDAAIQAARVKEPG